jgi:hypothetical protein
VRHVSGRVAGFMSGVSNTHTDAPQPAQVPPHHGYEREPQRHEAALAAQYGISPNVMAAVARALAHDGPDPAARQPASRSTSMRKYFSNAITTVTSDLPLPVIKELKAGFKNYIPLALCTHKACTNATRSSDAFDTEIGWTEKGEMRLKQKSMTAAKDHYLTTDDFTEIRENFIRGMRRYLVMGEDTDPGGVQASECGDMFAEFFSVIAARPDYTLDWPSYRGYIIESYTSWVGRRDDSYGLIFDEHLFYKYKMSNLVPVLLEQLRQPSGQNGTQFQSRGTAGMRGRGRGFQTGYTSSTNRGGYQAPGSTTSFLGQHQLSTSSRCYLCAGPHFHKEHQGAAT